MEEKYSGEKYGSEVDLRTIRNNITRLENGFCRSAYLDAKRDLKQLPEIYRNRYEGQFYQNLHEGLSRDLEKAAEVLRGGQFDGRYIWHIRHPSQKLVSYSSLEELIKAILDERKEISELSEGSEIYAAAVLENARKCGLKQEAKGIAAYLDYLCVNGKDLSNVAYFEFCEHLLKAMEEGVISNDYARPAFEFMERAHFKDYIYQKEELNGQLKALESDAKEFNKFMDQFNLI